MQLFLPGISLTVTCTCCTLCMQGRVLFESSDFFTHQLWLAQPQKVGNCTGALTWIGPTLPRSFSGISLLSIHLLKSCCFVVSVFISIFNTSLVLNLFRKSLTHGMRRWVFTRLYLAPLEEIKLFWALERFEKLFKRQE